MYEYNRDGDPLSPRYVRATTGDRWRFLRLLVLETARQTCEWCDDRATEVHHVHYESLEREMPPDLVALCHHCHYWHHVERTSAARLVAFMRQRRRHYRPGRDVAVNDLGAFIEHERARGALPVQLTTLALGWHHAAFSVVRYSVERGTRDVVVREVVWRPDPRPTLDAVLDERRVWWAYPDEGDAAAPVAA